ncbi:MAG: magnesium chelatase, partial [Balneolaceae bacterium]
LIPRTNRGIFVINELPDLQPRIQVALLNIMQERDIQIRGFNIRIPLDISMAFSANPEDYTSRGNLITPLKDRIDAQNITHYPKKLETGIKITRQEARLHSGDQIEIRIPDLCREIVEEVAIAARESEYVDQKSGVSTRLSITALEQACSAAERRALNNGSTEEYLRVSDFFHMIPALTGKLELVYEGEQEGATNVARHLIGLAISRTFSRWYPPTKSRRKKKLEQEPEEQRETSEDSSPYRKVLDWFAEGHGVELPDSLTEQEYRKRLKQVDGLLEIVQELRCYREEDEALLMDLLLEGLHQNSMLGKEDVDEERSFQDMLGTMLGRIGGVDEGL